MCGRYHIDEETAKDLQRIVKKLDEKMRIQRGDIHPADHAPIICSNGKELTATDMQWGFIGKNQKLLINARAENALERPTFSDSVLHRRCIVPAKHFYEWDKNKNKVIFRRNGSSTLYMAGFYQMYENAPHYIIITTRANESVSAVHDRMPLILKEEEIETWICDDGKVKDFLNKESPMLDRTQNYEQLSFF